jgi:hypothetical protein
MMAGMPANAYPGVAGKIIPTGTIGGNGHALP